MATAAAPNFEPAADAGDDFHWDPNGVQGLLQPKSQSKHYNAQIGAAAVYALLLGAIVTLSFKTAETPVEEQQVIELAPMPVEEEPPPEDTLPPPEELALAEPPPPPMIDPVAPVEEPKPEPKPIPKPKIERKIEKPPKPRSEAKPAAAPTRAPSARTAPGPRSDAPAVRAPVAPPGATPSAVANHFYSCLQRAASSVDAPMAGRVAYHASFSATGSMTSFSPSGGNSALVAIASRLAGRCGSVPAPGKPVSLSGGVTFSQ